MAPVRGQVFDPLNEVVGLPTQWGGGYADSGAGVSWRDLDGDGVADVVITAPQTLPRIYKGGADGSYTEVPDALTTIVAPAFALGHLLVDTDGDGDLDVLLLRRGRNALLRNDGDMAFTDVSPSHLPGFFAPSFSAAAGDLDGDGDTDIVVANGVDFVTFPRNECARNDWLINDGQGRFQERRDVLLTSQDGLPGCTLAVAMTDVDGDGDLDVLESNDFGMMVAPNRLWLNNGSGDNGAWTFTESATALGLDHGRFGMTAAIGDLNSDGFLDHIVTSIGRPLVLAGSDTGLFTDVTDAWAGSAMTLGTRGYRTTWDARVADFDGDGSAEAIITVGLVSGAAYLLNELESETLVLGKDDAGHWALNPTGWSIPTPDGGIARGMAVADYDGDGDLDLAVALTQGDPVLYRNTSAGQLPLRLTLKPTVTWSDVGARLWATCGETTRLVERTGGGATSGTGGVPIQFTFTGACGAPGVPVDVSVRWPSGYIQQLAAQTGDILTLVEPDWVSLSPSTLVLNPTRADGTLAPLESVQVTAIGATIGPLTTTPQGLSATVTAASGASVARIALSVDGDVLPFHPRVSFTSAPPTLSLRPQNATLFRPMTAFVSVPGPAANVAIAVGGGPTVTLADNADGTFSGQLPPWTATGLKTLTLLVDGVPTGTARELVVLPRVDEARSKVSFDGLQRLNGPTLSVTGLLADSNGEPWLPLQSELSLQVGDDMVAVQFFESGGPGFLASFNTNSWDLGASLQLFYKGVAVGRPQTLWGQSEPSPLDIVSPSDSWCVMARPSVRTDGEDASVLVLGLRDAGGSVVATDAEVGLALQGLVLVPEATEVLDGMYQLLVSGLTVEGPLVSPATAEVTLDDVAIGVTCRIELLSPQTEAALPGAGDFGESTTLEASHLEIATGLGGPDGSPPSTTLLTLAPRRLDGQLVGTGLGMVWSTTLGSLETTFYKGIGRYVATLRSDETGTATITATTASGRSWSLDILVSEGLVGPAVDEGPEAASEASQDLANPELSLELQPPTDEGVGEVDRGGVEPVEGQDTGCNLNSPTPMAPWWLLGTFGGLWGWHRRRQKVSTS